MRAITGADRLVKETLLKEIGQALAEPGQQPLMLLVPEQYTLQAELDLTDQLGLPGSFRLQVLSPRRLYSRIFEQAGSPAAVRIDERGRTMLMHRALSQLDEALVWYRGSHRRRGFAQLATELVAQFKQAGLDAEDVRALALAEPEGPLRLKLTDLAQVFACYDRALTGRFLDGEDEVRAAAGRMPQVPMLAGARVWAYGFDLVAPPLAHTLVALDGVCRQLTLALTTASDPEARDGQAYQPVVQSLARLRRQLESAGRRLEVAPTGQDRPADAPPELAHLERELFSWPHAPFPGIPQRVHLAGLNTPQQEALYVAALARHLVRTQGWRYRDIGLVCQNLPEYAQPLTQAFALYEVPLFLESSRPALNHPLCRYLISAIRLAERGWRSEEAICCLKSGYSGLMDEEAERLENYAVSYGLKGRAWRNPLFRGDAEALAALEPLRQLFAEPLIELDLQLKGASNLEAQLSALYHLLEQVGAYDRLAAAQRALAEDGQWQAAGEVAQVWNRIMGCLDQMHQLLGEGRLALSELAELLEAGLSASEVKPLPQSGDAVAGGSLGHLKSRPLRALFLVGMSDRTPEAPAALIADHERRRLSERSQTYLGMDSRELERMLKLQLKATLALAQHSVYVSYARGSQEGSAQQPGSLVVWLRALFPNLVEQGGLTQSDELLALMLGAPRAALTLLSPLLREHAEGAPLPLPARAALHCLGGSAQWRAPLAQLNRALRHRVASPSLTPALARALYAPLDRVSASRLERFAQCPFAHFARYGLKPEPLMEYEVTPQDDGEFFHQALEELMSEMARSGEALDEEQAMREMDRVADRLLSPLLDGPLGSSATNRAHAQELRAVARRAARLMSGQLKHSGFAPCALEVRFGEEEPRITLHPPGGEVALSGRIDRIDRWDSGAVHYLRIIDYKTGGKQLSLREVYFGLQLQLMLYLAAALKSQGGLPAGALYFTVADPLITTQMRDPALVEQERLKKLKLTGMVLSDPKVLDAMSPEYKALVSTALSGSERDFELLIGHALALAERLVAAIRAGDTAISPVDLGAGRSACSYCEYAPICQIDPRLPGGRKRSLEKIKNEEVLQRLREEADENVDSRSTGRH